LLRASAISSASSKSVSIHSYESSIKDDFLRLKHDFLKFHSNVSLIPITSLPPFSQKASSPTLLSLPGTAIFVKLFH
jgi:hypothetical protein